MALIAMVGCGRIGFDASSDATAGDAIAATPIVEQIPCAASIFLDTGGASIQDGFVWVNEPAADWLIALEHITEFDHPLRRYAIESPSAGTVRLRAMGVMASTEHAHGLIAEPVGTGYVMSYSEFYGGSASTMQVTPDMVVTNTHPLGPFVPGSAWFARAGGGSLAAIGVVSGELDVRGLGDDGSPTTTTVLAASATGPALPTLTPLDAGLAVVWQTSGGLCRLATLRADLSVERGPVSLAVSACLEPQVAWLAGSRQLMVAAIDGNSASLYASAFDDTLAPVRAPILIATPARAPRIATDATGLWITWADTAMLPSVRSAHLDAAGAVISFPALGMIDETVPHYQILQRVAGSLVVLWVDVAQNRSLSATRLCL